MIKNLREMWMLVLLSTDRTVKGVRTKAPFAKRIVKVEKHATFQDFHLNLTGFLSGKHPLQFLLI